jgi:cell division protein FtsN
MKQQRGGTLLGLIIGIVIGLAMALVVALYVTKTPVPFLNKGQNRTPEQDAAEERRNKDWDPNAPLKGKAPTAAASTPATPAPAMKPPAKAEGKDSKPPADPLGDLAKAKAGTADPFAYFIQVGAFRTAEDAETQRAKLTLTGVEAKVTEREQAGRMIYRVRVGPYDKKEDAEKVKGQIEAAGHETALVRVQR